MSGKRTILWTLIGILGLAVQAVGGPVGASRAADRADLYLTFAGCVGRFSAEMEHAWLMNDAEAAEYEDRRRVFLSLMEAIPSQTPMRQVLAHRIDAKHAHAALLSKATFGLHDRAAAQASARYHVGQCQSLLLDG